MKYLFIIIINRIIIIIIIIFFKEWTFTIGGSIKHDTMCLSPTDYSSMSLIIMKPCDSTTNEVSILYKLFICSLHRQQRGTSVFWGCSNWNLKILLSVMREVSSYFSC